MKHNQIASLIFVCAVFLFLQACNRESITVTPEEALQSYLSAAGKEDAKTVEKMYGGDYNNLQIWTNESNHLKAISIYLKRPPLTINQIKETRKNNNDEYVLTITLKNADGTIFTAGSSEPKQGEFTYTYKKIKGSFKFLELPYPYQG